MSWPWFNLLKTTSLQNLQCDSLKIIHNRKKTSWVESEPESPHGKRKRSKWEKNLRLSAANPCPFKPTMESHIIFSSTVEQLTPGRFAFTQTPEAAQPHPKPKASKSLHNILQGGGNMSNVWLLSSHPLLSFLSDFFLPPSESIITPFSPERYFPLLTKDWKDCLFLWWGEKSRRGKGWWVGGWEGGGTMAGCEMFSQW